MQWNVCEAHSIYEYMNNLKCFEQKINPEQIGARNIYTKTILLVVDIN